MCSFIINIVNVFLPWFCWLEHVHRFVVWMPFKGGYWILEKLHGSENQIYRLPKAIFRALLAFCQWFFKCPTYSTCVHCFSAVVRHNSESYHGCHQFFQIYFNLFQSISLFLALIFISVVAIDFEDFCNHFSLVPLVSSKCPSSFYHGFQNIIFSTGFHEFPSPGCGEQLQKEFFIQTYTSEAGSDPLPRWGDFVTYYVLTSRKW